MADVKKFRSPKLNIAQFIRAMVTLRHQLEKAPTVQQLTNFINTHTFNEDGQWVPNAEGVPNGLRNSLSIASKLSQTRGEIEERVEELGQEYVDTLLSVLEVSGMERAKSDLRSIVTDIKSLGILFAPANMVAKSGHVGTNGQPVGNALVEA